MPSPFTLGDALSSIPPVQADPRQVDQRKKQYQQAMQARFFPNEMPQGQQPMAPIEQPQNVGQGMSAVAQALNYRSMNKPQVVADPWANMRQAQGAGIPSSVMSLFR